MAKPLFERHHKHPSEGLIRSQVLMTEEGHATDWINIGTRQHLVLIVPGALSGNTVKDKGWDTKHKGERPEVVKDATAAWTSQIAVDWRDAEDSEAEFTEIRRWSNETVFRTGEEIFGGGMIRLRMAQLTPGESIYAELRREVEDNNK